jgi:hypothetical protein
LCLSLFLSSPAIHAAPLPNELVYIDVMNNSLTGPLPDFSEAPGLTLADFSDNQLTGGLPPSFGAAASNLVYLDVSQNELGGDINPGTLWERLPQLQYCFLQENALEGELLITENEPAV